MQIIFSPMRSNVFMELSKFGDTLNINGEILDFSGLADGETLSRSTVSSDWLASDVARVSGEIHLTLILPHGANAPVEARFPAPLNVAEDGPVTLPFDNMIIPEVEEPDV